MTRQTKRRIAAVGLAAAAGVLSPMWGPALMRTVPAFTVSAIEVEGSRFVAPEDVRVLADIPAGASVWDDHSQAEMRLQGHPLVEEVRIRRAGFDRLAIHVREVQPIALVPAPMLEPVDARGSIMPLNPAEHALDLPILLRARVEKGRVSDEGSRRVLSVLERLEALSPGFVHRVSEARSAEGDAIELVLLEGSHVGRILLPIEDAERAFLRAEDAISECTGRGRVLAVDGRFRGQIVVEIEEAA